MTLRKVDSLAKYFEYLRKNAAEVQELCEDFFIHVTGFFRDSDSFEVLRTRVFPKLIWADSKNKQGRGRGSGGLGLQKCCCGNQRRAAHDSSKPWIRHDISRRRRGMYDQFVAKDMDKDGDLDFVTTRGNSSIYDGALWLEQVRTPMPVPSFTQARTKDSPEIPLP